MRSILSGVILSSIACSSCFAGSLTMLSSITEQANQKVQEVEISLNDVQHHVTHYYLENNGPAKTANAPSVPYQVQLHETYLEDGQERTWTTACIDPWGGFQGVDILFDPKVNYQINIMQAAKDKNAFPNCYVVRL